MFAAPLMDGYVAIQDKPKSWIAEDHSLDMEGFVARPSVELRDRMGHRIITKVKVKDFVQTGQT